MKKINASEVVLPIDLLVWEDGPFAALPQESYEGLRESIRRRGVISPIVVRRMEDGRYWVIDGRNRIRACLELGLSEIPARVLDVTQEEAELLTYHAEIYRRHLKEGELDAFLAQLRRLESDLRKQYRRVLRNLVGLENEEDLAKLSDEEIEEIMELVNSLSEKAPVLVEAVKEKIKRMAEEKAARESRAAEIEQLKKALEEKEAELDALEADLHQLESEKQQLAKEKDDLVKKLRELEENMKSKVQEAAAKLALKQNEDLEKELQKRIEEVQKEKVKIEAEIRKIREAYNKQIVSLKEELKKAKENEKRQKEKEKFYLNQLENMQAMLENLNRFLKSVAAGNAVLIEFQLIQSCLDGVRNFFLMLQEEGGEALLTDEERMRMKNRWEEVKRYVEEVDGLAKKALSSRPRPVPSVSQSGGVDVSFEDFAGDEGLAA